jgi:hypothetical protein
MEEIISSETSADFQRTTKVFFTTKTRELQILYLKDYFILRSYQFLEGMYKLSSPLLSFKILNFLNLSYFKIFSWLLFLRLTRRLKILNSRSHTTWRLQPAQPLMEISIAEFQSYLHAKYFLHETNVSTVVRRHIGCSERRLIGHSLYHWNFLQKSFATCREKCRRAAPRTGSLINLHNEHRVYYGFTEHLQSEHFVETGCSNESAIKWLQF